jgi:hypothetical protein
MKALISSLLLVVLAVASNGCMIVDSTPPRGHWDAHRQVVRPLPPPPHGHDYRPPERHHGYADDPGRR